jgi:hypothetical protein
MTAPLSLRLNDNALQCLFFEASLEGIPPRTLAQRLIDEGLRMQRHPRVGFMNGATGRRAYLLGTGVDIWELIDILKACGGDVDEAMEYTGRSRPDMDAAIAYYGAYPDEIDARVEANRIAGERGKAEYLAGLERAAG